MKQRQIGRDHNSQSKKNCGRDGKKKTKGRKQNEEIFGGAARRDKNKSTNRHTKLPFQFFQPSR